MLPSTGTGTGVYQAAGGGLGLACPWSPPPPQQGSEFENLTIPAHSGTVDPSAFCSQHIVASRHTRT